MCERNSHGHTDKNDVMHVAFRRRHFSSGPQAHHRHHHHHHSQSLDKSPNKSNFTDALFAHVPKFCRRFRHGVLFQTAKHVFFGPKSHTKGPNHASDKSPCHFFLRNTLRNAAPEAGCMADTFTSFTFVNFVST